MKVEQRVLLVEDEPDIADMLRLFFTWRGYDFHHACTGEEALDLASRVMPHVILMDLSLPDTDGYTLTVQLRWRLRTAHIPIIFLSKWSGRDERLIGLALGADDYLGKPFDLQELLLRVQNSIAHAARDRLTDLRTGLPAVSTVRDLLEDVRGEPSQAIIEVALEYANPFRSAYGDTAMLTLYQDIGLLLLNVVNNQGSLEDFIGYLDEAHFVILTRLSHAEAIASQITAVFNHAVSRYYTEADRQRGALLVGGDSSPLMHLLCRITAGDRHVEVL
jgi:DNA-binding response OmpR family regulator